MPNSRAACRWLIPSTWQARRTRAYKSTIFIPQAFRSPLRRKARQRANFAPPQPDYPAASVRDFLSAALTSVGQDEMANDESEDDLRDRARAELEALAPRLIPKLDYPNEAEALVRDWYCTAPGYLDNKLRYAARLKVSSCQAARIWAGLRYSFFSTSHSAL